MVITPDAGIPRAGVIKVAEVRVLLVKVSVPAKVASVPPAAGKIAVPEAVPPALRIVLPLVEPTRTRSADSKVFVPVTV